MNTTEIVYRNIFDPSVMENALKGASVPAPAASAAVVVGAQSSNLGRFLITVLIIAAIFFAIWALINWWNENRETEILVDKP